MPSWEVCRGFGFSSRAGSLQRAGRAFPGLGRKAHKPYGQMREPTGEMNENDGRRESKDSVLWQAKKAPRSKH